MVHGIGQQAPLATMPGYVAAVVGRHDLNFGAPDETSEFHDLRRVKVTWLPELEPPRGASPVAPEAPVNTDFFELYWANLVQGSEMRHVVTWLLALLPRWRSIAVRFRRFLKFHAFYALAVLGVAVVVFVLGWGLSDASPVVGRALRWAAGLAGAGAVSWVVWYLGDVPRYMYNVADNVSVQREVRRQGVELLRRLHEKTYTGSDRPMYDRIVVIGHSLGTVVAYDIVRDYWSEVYPHYAVDPNAPGNAATRAGDDVDRAGEKLWQEGATLPSTSDPGFTEFQTLQRRLHTEMNERAMYPPPGADSQRRWAITDLLTLACPLTHADFLVGESRSALEDAQWQRQLASCPPRRQMAQPSYRFTYVHGPRKGLESWHQAACFAFTRWTNVYFEADVVGGPLQPLFGPGIVDIVLANPKGLAGRMPKVHSEYTADPDSIAIIRRVVWDGASRAADATLDGWLKASLRHALDELRTAGTTGSALRAVAARARLLDRLTPEQLETVVTSLEELTRAGSTGVDDLVDRLASDKALLGSLRVLDTLVPSSLEGETESMETEERGPEEEEAEAEEFAPEEEQPEEQEE